MLGGFLCQKNIEYPGLIISSILATHYDIFKDQKNYQNSEDVIGRFSFDVDAIDLNDLVATGYKAWKHWKQLT